MGFAVLLVSGLLLILGMEILASLRADGCLPDSFGISIGLAEDYSPTLSDGWSECVGVCEKKG